MGESFYDWARKATEQDLDGARMRLAFCEAVRTSMGMKPSNLPISHLEFRAIDLFIQAGNGARKSWALCQFTEEMLQDPWACAWYIWIWQDKDLFGERK